MLNSIDQEQVVKSSQTANLLVQDLRELVKAKNPLLGEIAIEILEQAVLLEQRLRRIESIATSTDNIE
jgi:hypothetical protein